jgi:hypothetical protein
MSDTEPTGPRLAAGNRSVVGLTAPAGHAFDPAARNPIFGEAAGQRPPARRERAASNFSVQPWPRSCCASDLSAATTLTSPAKTPPPTQTPSPSTSSSPLPERAAPFVPGTVTG